MQQFSERERGLKPATTHSTKVDPHENIALDEALFHQMERCGTGETLRIWESSRTAVIVGALGSISRQVHEESCHESDVPIIRRVSGGGAVVIGPGCLNFSLVLSMERRPELHGVADSYALILTRIIRCLGVQGLAVRGTSDLAIGDRKISGNSQRRGRRALLHHGTILYDFDLPLLDRYLKDPPRPPAYRCGRSHQAFVTNVPLTRTAIEQAIASVRSTF
jgi:lipoate-protein ligase A